MNGQFLGCRSIRTNWATRKPPSAKAEGKYLYYKVHVVFFAFLSLLPLSVWMCKETWWSVDSNKKKSLNETVEYWNGQFNSSPSHLIFSEKETERKKKSFLIRKSLRRESEQRRKKKKLIKSLFKLKLSVTNVSQYICFVYV